MNGLSLFSGAGIGELAFKYILPDYRTIGYVEIDRYCRSIIRARIRDGILNDAPIFDDIREFNKRYAGYYTGKVDWLSAGFPCQPFSAAGKRRGEDDERNMWPATIECIGILRPRYVFLENVSSIITHKYIHQIFGDMVEVGYDCEWGIVGASDVGAPHIRKRFWVLGIRDGINARRLSLHEKASVKSQLWDTKGASHISNVETSWFMANNMGTRIHDGLAEGMEQSIKALGNGWVPQVVKAILEVENMEEESQ